MTIVSSWPRGLHIQVMFVVVCVLCQDCHLFLSPESQVIVMEVVEKHGLEDYTSRHIASIVGFFSPDAVKEKEEFVRHWHNLSKVPAAVVPVDSQDESLSGGAYAVRLYRKYEQPTVLSLDQPLESLEQWFWNNAPTIEPHNPVRVNQLSTNRQYIVNLYSNFENETQAEQEYLTLLHVAPSFKTNFAFFYHDSGVHGSQLRGFSLNDSRDPQLLTLEYKTNQLYILKESYTAVSVQNYLQLIADGKYPPFIRSAKSPPPSSYSQTESSAKSIAVRMANTDPSALVREVTADSFEADILSSSDDVLLEIYQSWCDECVALKQMINFLASHVSTSSSLRVLRFDVGNNDLPFWIRLVRIPSIFLFPAALKQQKKYETFHGDITFKSLVAFLDKFASNKLEYTEDISQHPEVRLSDLQPRPPPLFGLGEDEDDDGIGGVPNPNQLIKDQFDSDDEILQLMNFLFGGVTHETEHDGHSHSHTHMVDPMDILGDLFQLQQEEEERERRMQEREKHRQWLQQDDKQFRRFLRTAYLKFKQHNHQDQDDLDTDIQDQGDQEDEYDEEEFHRLVMLMMKEMQRVQRENVARKRMSKDTTLSAENISNLSQSQLNTQQQQTPPPPPNTSPSGSSTKKRRAAPKRSVAQNAAEDKEQQMKPRGRRQYHDEL